MTESRNNTPPNDSGDNFSGNSSGSSSVVDLDLLQTTFAQNPDILRQICQEYLNQLKNVLAKLEEAKAKEDFATMAKEAHTLKGNAALIGAKGVEQSALMVEKACRNQNRQKLDLHLPELLNSAKKSQEVLNEFLQKDKG